MTRRIAISILITVWLVLVLAGGLSYFVTRSMLIEDLDRTLVGRIASLPSIERPASFSQMDASADTRDRFVVQDNEGKTIARPAPASTSDIPEPRILEPRIFSRLDGSLIRTLKVQAFAHRNAPGDPLVPVTVVYSGNADHLDALLSRLMVWLGIYGLLAGLVTAGVAVIIARTTLRPLRTTAQSIGEINEKNLNRRIEVDRLPPELAPVGHRLNDMLGRLESAFKQRKQFLADASHELRTPVAALITTLEVTLHKNRSSEEYLRTLESCLADARLLHQLVASLLDHVRGEHFASAAHPLELAPVRISAVLDHCAQIAATLGAKKNIRVEKRFAHDIVGITDELKLRSIITNLLSNAVEYTPPGGQVTLALELQKLETGNAPGTALFDAQSVLPQLVRFSVADTGPGIAAEHIPHLFEPFYRADKARSHGDLHLGLGLFLVRAHAQALGGDCRVKSPISPILPSSMFVVEVPMLMVPAKNAQQALSAGRVTAAGIAL